MSFLDRFKRKGPASAELEPPLEAPARPAEPARKADPAAIKAAAQQVLARYQTDFNVAGKKDPRLAPPVLPPPADSSPASTAPPGSIPGPAALALASENHELQLELGDFLHRIPKTALAEGNHDVHRVLTFRIDEMADRISRGLTTIPLAEIYRQVPNVFRTAIKDAPEAEIRFPWQKVMILLNESRGAGKGSSLSEAAARALAAKLKAQRPARNIIPIKQETEPLIPPPVQARAAVAEPKILQMPGTATPAAPKPAPAAKETPAKKEAASKPPTVAPEPAATSSDGLTEDERVTRDELLRARGIATQNAARLKSEYEGLLAAARDERKGLVEDRDRIAAQLSQAQQDVLARQTQIDAGKSRAEQAAQALAALQKERDVKAPAQAQAEAQHEREIQALQDKATDSANDQRRLTAELTQARERCETLGAQLATAEQAREEAGRRLEESTAALRREFEAAAGQRQAEAAASLQQLQERLQAAEAERARIEADFSRTTQAREAERRAAEKRLETETAHRIEETATRLRAEFADARQQHEAGRASALQELQDQLQAAQAHSAKLAAEIEQGRRALTESSRQIEQRLRHESERALGVERANLIRDLDQAKRQRESEISGSLKQLQDKLQIANGEQARLKADLEKATAARSESVRAAEQRLKQEHQQSLDLVKAELQREWEAQRQKLDAESAVQVRQLVEQVQAATDARAKIFTELEHALAVQTETAKASAVRLDEAVARAGTEAAEAARQTFATERQAREAESAAALRKLEEQLQATHEARTQALDALEHSKLALTESAQQLERRHAGDAQRQVEAATARLRGELEADLQRRATEAATALARLQEECDAATAGRTRLAADLEHSRAAGTQALQAVEARLTEETARQIEAVTARLHGEAGTARQTREAEATAARGQLETQLQAATAEHTKLSAELEKARADRTETAKATAARFAKEIARAGTEATEAAHESFAAERQSLQAEGAAALHKLGEQLQSAHEARARAVAELEHAKLAFTESAQQLEQRHAEDTARKIEEATAKLRGEFAQEEQRRAAEAATALARLQQEFDAASAASAQLAAELAQAKAGGAEALQVAETRLNEDTARQIQAVTVRLRDEAETARQAHDAAATAARQPLEAQLQAATAEQTKLSAECDRLRAASHEATGAAERHLEATLARRSTELTGQLRAEFEAEKAQRETASAATLQQLQQELQTATGARTQIAAELEQARAAASAAETESARKLERTVADLRKEFDATLRQQREEATAEAHQAGTLQLASATDTLRRDLQATAQQREATLTGELEELRAKVQTASHAQGQLTAELERTQTAHAALVAAGAASTALVGSFESRAVAQLEADIDTYRTRIKSFMKERDQARAAADSALAEAHALSEKVAAEQTAVETARDGMEKRLANADRTTAERLAAIRKLESEAAQRAKDHQRALAAQKSQHDGTLQALRAGKESALAALTTARDQALAARTALEKQLTETTQTATTRQTHIEKLQADLGRATAEHGERLTHIQQLDQEIARRASDHQQSLAAQTATHTDALAKLRQETDAALAALAAEHQSTIDSRSAVEEKLVASTRTGGERQAEIARLCGEIETAQKTIQQKEQSIAELNRRHDERLEQIQQLEAEMTRRSGEQQQLLATRVSEHEGILVSLRAEKDAAVASLSAARDHVVAARGEVEKRLAESERLSAERLGQLERLKADLVRTGDRIREKEQEIAQLGAGHRSALEQLAATHEQTLARHAADKEASLADLARARDASLAALAAERDDERKGRAHTAELLTAAGKTTRDLNGRIQQLEADLTATGAEMEGREKEIARLGTTHHESLLAQNHQHQQALAALGAIRDALIGERDSVLTSRTQLESQIGDARRLDTERLARIEELDNFVQHARTLVRQRDETIARLTEEQQQATAAQAQRHEHTLNVLTTEKDAAIANLAAEKANLAAEHDKRLTSLVARHEHALEAAAAEKTEALTALRAELERGIATIEQEKKKILAAKTTAEARIGELAAERDDAVKDSAAVAQHLAAVTLDAEKRIDELQAESAAIVANLQKTKSDLLDAGEAHKAQSTVFAREFKTMLAQRDQALAELQTTLQHTAEKETTIAAERAALQRLEAELSQQHEREMFRLRRERDSVIQQRDALRSRFERVVEEQRELLSDLDSAVPGGARPEPARHSARQAAAESNVIDISEAEIRRTPDVLVETGTGLRIPLARPISIPPPNVRLL